MFHIIFAESYYNVRHPQSPSASTQQEQRKLHRSGPSSTLIRLPRQPEYMGQMPGKSHTSRTTGPVFTIVKTDPNANFRWGVRHFVGKKYA